jgi:hypothetical protein
MMAIKKDKSGRWLIVLTGNFHHLAHFKVTGK